MKIRRIIPKRKLKVTATARRAPQRGMEDFGHEPSVSFGKALIVFIVLHVVAVSGIYIFNSLKARNIEQSPAPATHAAKQQSTPAPAELQVAAHVQNTQLTQETKPVTRVQPKLTAPAASLVEAVHRRIAEEPAAKPTPKPTVKPTPKPTVKPQAKDSDAVASAKDLGQVYAVVKGDTLVSIARKFHVTTASLLKLNNIDDPKKLRIGQKLRIPPKAKKPATTFNFHSVRVC